MKKRVIAVLMCAVMLLGAAACGTKEKKLTPKEEYIAAAQKVEKAKGIDFTMKFDMSMEVSGGAVVEVGIIGDGKVVQEDKKDKQMMMDMKISALGLSVPVKYYYKDNYIYIDAQREKSKVKMDVEEMEKKVAGSYKLATIDKKMIKDVKIKEDGGNRIFTITIDEKKLDEYGQKYFDSVQNLTSGSGLKTDLDLKMQDFKCTMKVDKKGMPIEQKVSFKAAVEANGEKAVTTSKMTLKYKKIGNNIKIKFPSFDDYTERSAL